jgi:hypothetical protein
MTLEYIIGAAIVALIVAMYFKFKEKPVDMDHKAPNVHNEVMEGKVGPATAAEKPAAPAKKTTKKKTTKKKAAVDLDSMKKNELLAHAKANGIKANASMNKAALIDAIRNG